MTLSPSSRVCFYTRYSKGDEAEKELSIEAQVSELAAYAAKHGLVHVGTFADRDISGRVEEREQFQEMIAQAKLTPKPFDGILCWKFNRFSRRVEHRLVYRSLLRRQGIEVVSIQEPAMEGAMGALIDVVLAAVDEFMAMQIAEDTLRGLKQLARNGFFTGGIPPKGLRRVQVQTGTKANGEPVFRTKLELDPEWAPRVRQAFEMVTQGRTAEQIIALTGVVSNKSSLPTFFRNRRLIGEETYNRQRHIETKAIRRTNDRDDWIVVPGAYPAVVPLELFAQVQAILDARRPVVTTARQRDSVFLFTDLLYCNVHRAPYVGTSNGHHEYYVCSERNKHGKHAADCRMIYREPFEEMILSHLKRRVFNARSLKASLIRINREIAAASANHDERIEAVSKTLAQARREQARLHQAIREGIPAGQLKQPLDEVTARIATLESERARIEASNQVQLPTSDEQVRAMAEAAGQLLSESEPAVVKAFLRKYVHKLVIEGDHVVIYYSMERVAGLASDKIVVTNWLPESGANTSLQQIRIMVAGCFTPVRRSRELVRV